MFAQPVKTNVALERKMKRLQRHADMIEALAICLSKHPGIAERCELKPLDGKMGLDLDDRGLIAPMGKYKIVLRLSRYSRVAEEENVDTLVRDDVTNLSSKQLTAALLEMGVDLSKPPSDDD